MNTERNDSGSGARKGAKSAVVESNGRSVEVTGLGMIVALAIAFASLASDGTIQLSQYLVFLSLMLVSAGGIVWRLKKLTPGSKMQGEERVKPGVYRVLFGGR
jgi:hypothetical protein